MLGMLAKSLLKFFFLIYLAAVGLSCDTQNLWSLLRHEISLVVACGSSSPVKDGSSSPVKDWTQAPFIESVES